MCVREIRLNQVQLLPLLLLLLKKRTAAVAAADAAATACCNSNLCIHSIEDMLSNTTPEKDGAMQCQKRLRVCICSASINGYNTDLAVHMVF